MNKKRLLKLADYLETVPRKRFDMANWADDEFCGKPNESKHKDCWSAACAIGWATTIPSFKRAGLKLLSLATDSSLDPPVQSPVYENYTGMPAVAHFFNIPYYDAEDLFIPNGKNNTPKLVAKKIRKFVNENS